MADRGAIAKTAEPAALSGTGVVDVVGFIPGPSAVTHPGGATVFAPALPEVGLVLTGSAGSVVVAGSGNSVVIQDA